MTRELCYENAVPDPEKLSSYNKITLEMQKRGLDMPDWWIEEFPPFAQ